MIAMKWLVVSMGLLLIGLCPALLTAEWGKPLGGAYDGPEGKPRVVTPAPAEWLYKHVRQIFFATLSRRVSECAVDGGKIKTEKSFF